MKKTSLITIGLITCLIGNAQTPELFNPLQDRQFLFDSLNICAVLAVIYMISSFILQIIRQQLDYRIKNRILEKAPAETVVTQLLSTGRPDTRKNILQWFFVLAGIGIGCGIIHFAGPFGIHSIAIMAICLAGSFGGYYFFTKG